MRKTFIFIIVIISIFTQSPRADEKYIEHISEWFHGEYSTTEQATLEPKIIDLNLRVSKFSIKETEGIWILLETAFSKDKLNPYKVDVYHISDTKYGLLNMDKYSCKNADNFKGAFTNDSLLQNMSLEQLELKSNCSIILRYFDDVFVGSTVGKKCVSTLRNAKYTTTDLEITKKDFFLWEKGFDGRGTHVWGSAVNGYIFKKLK